MNTLMVCRQLAVNSKKGLAAVGLQGLLIIQIVAVDG